LRPFLHSSPARGSSSYCPNRTRHIPSGPAALSCSSTWYQHSSESVVSRVLKVLAAVPLLTTREESHSAEQPEWSTADPPTRNAQTAYATRALRVWNDGHEKPAHVAGLAGPRSEAVNSRMAA
jgi:hypothetical protein